MPVCKVFVLFSSKYFFFLPILAVNWSARPACLKLRLFLPPFFCSVITSCSSADRIPSSSRSLPITYGPNKSLKTPAGTYKINFNKLDTWELFVFFKSEKFIFFFFWFCFWNTNRISSRCYMRTSDVRMRSIWISRNNRMRTLFTKNANPSGVRSVCVISWWQSRTEETSTTYFSCKRTSTLK